MRKGAFLAAFVIAVLLATARAFAAPCTLVAVERAEDAQLKVYFTKFLKEDNSGGKYKACRIVPRAEKDSVSFFVTPFRQDATIVVHRSNWPG